ncbi:alpha/beta fold hydrolase [Labrys okinawensis]|uniref:alpha/beta fold hydrolase n=1 Tax=Labrys okinawensis TaxID=346911 RepID=UPI0039BC23F9
MAHLHLSLLGGFELVDDAAALPVLGRKARAILAYLASQPGHSQSREKIVDLLWGGHGEVQARMSLRQTLHAMRKLRHPSDAGRFLTDGDNITLNLDDVEVDVAHFTKLVAGSTPEQFERALALYHGDFLDGFRVNEEPFEEWCRIERERLRAAAITAMDKLIAHYSTTSDLASCLRMAMRLLALEPLREDIHRALMRTYAAQGRFSLALKQYEQCRDVLQRQLGLQPEPATRELHEGLRTRRMASASQTSPEQASAGEGPSRMEHSMRPPPTHYVKSGGSNIAYQVTGDGPIDLIYVPGWVSNLDFTWTSPRLTHVLRRLGSFTRLIRMDKRGTGLSDRSAGFQTLDQRMEDVRAVLDAAGSKRTVLFGSSEGGNMCMLFAATYPDRTAALVLNGAFAKGIWSEDYPWAKTMREMEEELAAIERDWGEPADLSNAAPSLMKDPFEREWFATYLRNSASPSDAISLWRWNTEIDVRDILPAIHVPTLIIHRTGDRWVKVEEGRYLARHIAGAKYAELQGEDHVIWGNGSDGMVDEIQAFLSGVPPKTPVESVLVTVLHMEIVGLPAPVTGIGEEVSRDLTGRFDDEIRDEIHLIEGSEVVNGGNPYRVVFKRPTQAIQCAIAIRSRMNTSGLRARAAIHIGECEKRGGDFTGTVIELTSRLLYRAQPGEILASRTVRDLVAHARLSFEERGEIKLDGSTGTMQFFSVEGSRLLNPSG